MLGGVGIGAKAAVGDVLRLEPAIFERRRSQLGVSLERASLTAKLAAVVDQQRAELEHFDPEAAEIAEAMLTLLSDPELLLMAQPMLDAGWDAASALHSALEEIESAMLGDDFFSSRALDLRGLIELVITELRGDQQPPPIPSGRWVIVAKQLTLVAVTSFGPSVVGVITEEGGPTSHAAVSLRARGIPAVLACSKASVLENGERVLIDPLGDRVVRGGVLSDATGRFSFRADQPSPLIRVLANIGSLEDARASTRVAADGVGLMRTELIYLGAVSAPTLESQAESYREIFSAAASGELIVRTIDPDVDKPVPFLPSLGLSSKLDDPGLGLRQIPLDFIETQLRAIALAQGAREISVIAPMIASFEDAQLFLSLARSFGLSRVGLMIETTEILPQLERLLGQVDFVSVGTNDLAQFLFRSNRTSAADAWAHNPWQPELLRTVANVLSSCQAAGVPAGVCGESAADPFLAIVYAGFGASSVSVSPSSVLEINAALRSVDLSIARRAADAALRAQTALEAKQLVLEALDN